ncbi:hypothetical protein AKO1_007373 [Acrasis kona]|uniref:Uncharacterized protein n=1 Tax=Acrasis kona TaxID=1008807 RepID=A0AAW2YSQ8_9EUKA
MRFVMFDIGGVLANDMFNVLFETLLASDVESDKSELKQIMSIADEVWGDYKLGKITEDEFFKTIIQKSSISSAISRRGHFTGDDEGLLNYLKKTLREQNFALFTETVQFASKLKSVTNIKIGILSNHSKEWIHDLFLLNDGLLNQVFDNKDLVVISCDDDICAAKPDFKVYEGMLSRIKLVDPHVSLDQIIFIDDKKRNTDAAIHFGITHSIHFDARKQSVEQHLRPQLEQFSIFY